MTRRASLSGVSLAGALLTGLVLTLQSPILPASAATPPAAEAAGAEKGMTVAQFNASLHWQNGTITLPGGKATLTLPAGYRYLDPDDTQRVLEMVWNNPKGDGTLGMIMPERHQPTDRDSWGVVLTYKNDGHVSDKDANGIDYDDLLKQMQEQTDEANEARTKQGYGAMKLVEWAEPPHYDAAHKKLYWAQHLHIDGAESETLNYNIRVLGRTGVLVLTAVSDLRQLDEIRPEMQTLLAATEFTPGNRYSDFDATTDKVAAYGLAALVAGGVAAKTGLLAKLLMLLLAAKKLVAIAVVGLIALVRKLFGGGSKDKDTIEAPTPDGNG